MDYTQSGPSHGNQCPRVACFSKSGGEPWAMGPWSSVGSGKDQPSAYHAGKQRLRGFLGNRTSCRIEFGQKVSV